MLYHLIFCARASSIASYNLIDKQREDWAETTIAETDVMKFKPVIIHQLPSSTVDLLRLVASAVVKHGDTWQIVRGAIVVFGEVAAQGVGALGQQKGWISSPHV